MPSIVSSSAVNAPSMISYSNVVVVVVVVV